MLLGVMLAGVWSYPLAAKAPQWAGTQQAKTPALKFKPPSRTAAVMMEADRLDYDTVHAIVTATGRVEVVQGEYILRARELTYDQHTRIVQARGDVSVLDPTGNVYFADSVALQDDMRAGVIHEFRARLSDNSLFAAREAERLDENRTELHQAVYSPCKLCAGGRAPLWQIKADDVLYDQEAQKVTYHHAFMEVYGVPVIYTPYFSHATPGADNKSGFLVPEYSNSSTLGSVLKVPYLYSIGPDKDITLTPILTSKEGPVLAMEYRQLTDNGGFTLEGSATYPDRLNDLGQRIEGREFRGHIRGNGNFQVNDVADWGFEVNRASDDTYLRRYNFSYEDTLTSRLYGEAINFLRDTSRTYAIVQAITFQGLTVRDQQSHIPVIAPMVDVAYESAPQAFGARTFLRANALSLTRSEGSDSRRLSATGGMRIPYVTAGGHVFEVAAQLRADAYSVADQTIGSGNFNGTVGRAVPQTSLSWRYPMVKQLQSASLVLEPQVELVVSPHGSNPAEIPNDDSQDQEFSTLNLFSTDRFAGLDRIETGTRINYGVRAHYQRAGGKSVSGVFGQTYHIDRETQYPLTSDPVSHQSDYVGSVTAAVAPFDVSYRFRLDQQNLAPKRNEVNLRYARQPVSLALDYILLDDDPILSHRQEVTLSGSLGLNKNWTLVGSGRRDLDDGGMLFAGAGLIFQNECVTVTTAFNRTYIRDRDVEPDSSFTVRLALKNLH